MAALVLTASPGAGATDADPCVASLTRPLRTVSIRFDGSIRFRGMPIAESYKFRETAAGTFEDVEGFFGDNGRVIPHLLMVFRNLDSKKVMVDSRLRSIQVEIDDGVHATQILNGFEYARQLWREQNQWEKMPFLPAGERSLMHLYGEDGVRVDQELAALARKYSFPVLALPETLTYDELRDYFRTQYVSSAADLQHLRNSLTEHNHLPFGMRKLLTKAARTIRFAYTELAGSAFYGRSKTVFDLRNLNEAQARAILKWRSRIRATIQEVRVAIRVNDLRAFSKTVRSAVEDGLISQAELQTILEKGVDPERELDILTADAIYEVKSSSPPQFQLLKTINPKVQRQIRMREVRQAIAQNAIADALTPRLPLQGETSGTTDSVPTRPPEFALDTNRKFTRFVVFADGAAFPLEEQIPTHALGVIPADGRSFQLATGVSK